MGAATPPDAPTRDTHMADILGNPNGFTCEALLHSLTWRVDGCVHVQFETQELNHHAKLAMASLHREFGVLAFCKDAGDIVKLPKVAKPDIKSRSQRLRDVLFRVWEQEGKPGTQEEYYAAEMERIIASYRRRLV